MTLLLLLGKSFPFGLPFIMSQRVKALCYMGAFVPQACVIAVFIARVHSAQPGTGSSVVSNT